ncbi:MAG: hypothetical protein ACRD27_09765 [Terracidiphilus sp.]
MHELALLLQNQLDPEVMRRIFTMLIPIALIFYVIVVALVMVPCWFICKKAGFSPWVALACILPTLGTLVLLYVLAFADWKVMPVPPQAYWPPQPYPPPPPAAPHV